MGNLKQVPMSIMSLFPFVLLMYHYANIPMHYAEIFKGCKKAYFQVKFIGIFLKIMYTPVNPSFTIYKSGV